MTAQLQPRPRPPSWTPPTRLSSIVFVVKVGAFRARRAARDIVAGAPRFSKAEASDGAVVLAENRTLLWPDGTPAERALQFGKVQNLRVACRALDGLMLPAGAVFSFWRHLGPPIRARGYVQGRMLQQGCMVAAVGGGLCQLSNALYEVALQAGCRIVERHAHSRIVPGSAAAWGRDATVAWNYVDLRFAPDQALRLTTRLDQGSLVVRLTGPETPPPSPLSGDGSLVAPALRGAAARSCGSCDETDCFRHEQRDHAPTAADRRVFLVDEAWPEFQDHVHGARGPADRLGLPIDGARLKLPRYAWRTDGFERTGSAPAAALRRAVALRRAGLQGAARRGAELAAAGRIATRLARLLTPEVAAVTVAQSYLPFLWRDGHLGGRQLSVLMTRLPMATLQARLDAHAAAHPERDTLADFRAPAWLVKAETEALAQAHRIVTPHAEIAALFEGRAERLPWRIPPVQPWNHVCVRRIAFPGPTVARKGAHLVREAAKALDLEVMLLGSELEGRDFWRGVDTIPAGDWKSAAVVVQPALVEDQPRRLLAALAAGMPVVATPACGLAPRPGLTLIPPDNPAALIAALDVLLAPGKARRSSPTG